MEFYFSEKNEPNWKIAIFIKLSQTHKSNTAYFLSYMKEI